MLHTEHLIQMAMVILVNLLHNPNVFLQTVGNNREKSIKITGRTRN